MAELLGAGIAEHGWSLITGGYSGVMEAASRGAKTAREDAHIIGVTTNVFANRRGANAYVNDERPQKGLLARIGYLMETADAYVLTWGSVGTLAELFLAWNLVATGWDKPVVAAGPWWHSILEHLQEDTEIDEKARAHLVIVPGAEAALRVLAERLE